MEADIRVQLATCEECIETEHSQEYVHSVQNYRGTTFNLTSYRTFDETPNARYVLVIRDVFTGFV